MQVLQLSDEQIALLPPDQRQSIMVLKDQIARSSQRWKKIESGKIIPFVRLKDRRRTYSDQYNSRFQFLILLSIYSIITHFHLSKGKVVAWVSRCGSRRRLNKWFITWFAVFCKRTKCSDPLWEWTGECQWRMLACTMASRFDARRNRTSCENLRTWRRSFSPDCSSLTATGDSCRNPNRTGLGELCHRCEPENGMRPFGQATWRHQFNVAVPQHCIIIAQLAYFPGCARGLGLSVLFCVDARRTKLSYQYQ